MKLRLKILEKPALILLTLHLEVRSIITRMIIIFIADDDFKRLKQRRNHDKAGFATVEN